MTDETPFKEDLNLLDNVINHDPVLRGLLHIGRDHRIPSMLNDRANGFGKEPKGRDKEYEQILRQQVKKYIEANGGETANKNVAIFRANALEEEISYADAEKVVELLNEKGIKAKVIRFNGEKNLKIKGDDERWWSASRVAVDLSQEGLKEKLQEMHKSISADVSEEVVNNFKRSIDSLVTEAHSNGLPDNIISDVLEAEQQIVKNRGNGSSRHSRVG